MRERLSPVSALYPLFGKRPEFGIRSFILLWTIRLFTVISEVQQNLGGNKLVYFKQSLYAFHLTKGQEQNYSMVAVF